MCIRYTSTYPCRHVKSRYELCNKAKASNLLHIGIGGKRADKTHCEDITNTIKEEANLEETCGSTCLTKPYRCNSCGSAKQLGWRCNACHAVRDASVLTWSACACPKHSCPENVLGKPFCDRCLASCIPPGKMVTWKCHSCGSAERSYSSEKDTECAKCLHVRCGECKFPCLG